MGEGATEIPRYTGGSPNSPTSYRLPCIEEVWGSKCHLMFDVIETSVVLSPISPSLDNRS